MKTFINNPSHSKEYNECIQKHHSELAKLITGIEYRDAIELLNKYTEGVFRFNESEAHFFLANSSWDNVLNFCLKSGRFLERYTICDYANHLLFYELIQYLNEKP
jgi:hypothetical protein